MPLNISYVLPCFKRARWLRMALRFNSFYRCPGAEVVLVLDEPTEELPILQIVKDNPEIKFKVVVNDWPHPWRPPCMAINVGVRHASAPHICILSPETLVNIPSVNYFESLLSLDWRATYAGLLWAFTDANPDDDAALIASKLMACKNCSSPRNIGFGFLLCQKYLFEQVRGMDERRIHYGGDDDDIRIRMCRMAGKMVIDPFIEVFHPTHDEDMARALPQDPMPKSVVLYHQDDTWGRAFNRVAYSWENP